MDHRMPGVTRRVSYRLANEQAKLDGLEHPTSPVPLDVAGDGTTPDILAIEQRSVAIVAAGVGCGACVASSAEVERAIAAGPSLSDEQAAMVRAICESGNRYATVIGRAGAGKTFTLDSARDAWESSGYRLLGTAPSARAAQEFRLAPPSSRVAPTASSAPSPSAGSASTSAQSSSSMKGGCWALDASPRSSTTSSSATGSSAPSVTRNSCPRSTPAACSPASPVETASRADREPSSARLR
jgi:hypothetical protein